MDIRPICAPTALAEVLDAGPTRRVLCPDCGASVATEARGSLSEVPAHPHRFG